MLIVDAHLDISWNALQWNRDLLRSVYTIRTQENNTPGKGRGTGTVAFPEMRRGRVALSFATLLARSTGHPLPHIDFANPVQSYGIARGQLHYYDALERIGVICIVRDLDSLRQSWEQWTAWDDSGADGPPPPLAFVISMEGADPIQQPEQVEEWYNLGLRLLGITHYGEGRYAGGTATESGLTPLGVPLLKEMERLKIALDLTHCSDPAFWEALDHYNGPVLASHNNARALVPNQRQFTDDQLRAVIERDGVIGAAFDAWMLKPGWQINPRVDPHNPLVKLDDVVDQIDYICQLAGNAHHAALGTDLDGGFGREQSPSDLDTIADLQRIPAMLAARGYAADDINAIMHGNWLRFLNMAWS